MSAARDLVYSFVNREAKLARQAVSRNPQDHAAFMAVEGGSNEDLYLHGLLNRVEDDRAHREARRIRKEAEETAAACQDNEQRDRMMRATGAMYYVADIIDPYEERDGQLVRKSDGQPVVL